VTDTSVTWLTQDAYDRLQAELERLSGPYRAEITERIAAARDEGDLKENGGYHAAREEQAKNEARIKELTEKLRTVQVGQPSDDGTVQPGMVVTVSIFGDSETFLLGSREMAGETDMDVFSPTSPLGAAIVDKKVGEKSSYEAPNGKTIDVEITDAKPFAA
jgi:transcription elongation factor GreA